MEITISKDEFESIVLVATSSHSEVFDMISPHFEESIDYCEAAIVGETAASKLSENNLEKYVKKYVSLHTFLSVFRSLDLTLTATGFGVVNNDNISPASTKRVDELESSLKTSLCLAQGKLVDALTKVSGWSDTPQASMQIRYPFYKFQQLIEFGTFPSPTVSDWANAQSRILDADRFLRTHIGNELMDELLKEIRTHSFSAAFSKVHFHVQNIINLNITDSSSTKKMEYDTLMNILESDLTTYKLYADSDAYQLNHFVNYENIKESGCFFWG